MANTAIHSSVRGTALGGQRSIHVTPFTKHQTSRPASRKCVAPVATAAPIDRPVENVEQWKMTFHGHVDSLYSSNLPPLISNVTVKSLETELDKGVAMSALRRFNTNLRKLPADRWEQILRPVFVELCYNLESFNPAFTACVLMVQKTIGASDYVRRDICLKNLIQPLAGEYGMHNGEPQTKTHRELFADFFLSIFGYPLEELLSRGQRSEAAELLFGQMMRDIQGGGGFADPLQKASYALGYNLAIEYLADYEKTWMLESFEAVDQRVFQDLGKKIDWVFLEVHAKGEAEHAAIGHNAILNFVPAQHVEIMRKGMLDHDRDFAVFYNKIADMLEA